MSKTQREKPIGVFDSGVGGLSVLIELKRLLPKENFVFIADQLYVPYGEKSQKELINLAYKITDYFINQHDIKMMVVACNTSTCYTIDELRKKYPFPIVGTVPAIKPAAEDTKTGTIGVISTPSTSKSEAVKKLIEDNCQNIKVFNIGCKNLEDAVEQGDLNSRKVSALLGKYLKDIKNSKADQLVLGCTHYPFLKQIIRKIISRPISLVDSGRAIARRTQFLLLRNKIKNNQKRGKTVFYTTGNPAKFGKVASKLLKKKIFAFKTIL